MPGRKFTTQNYRYGLNGQEKDDEINGIAGAYTSAEYWEYDSRLGRRWNRDPVVKPWESSYACFNNNPIFYADPSGLDGEEPAKDDCGSAPAPTSPELGSDQGTELTGIVKQNVVVIIKDSKRTYNIDAMRKDNKNWDFILANDIPDAEKQLRSNLKNSSFDEYQNIYFHGHGNVGAIQMNDVDMLTAIDFDHYEERRGGNQSTENYLEDAKIDAIESLDEIAGMISKNGNLFFGACFAAKQYDNGTGKSYHNNLPSSLGKSILKNHDIDIFMNNDATYFTTENGMSILNFDTPLSPAFSLREGFTVISKNDSNMMSVNTFKLQLQLNSHGTQPVVPVKPPLK